MMLILELPAGRRSYLFFLWLFPLWRGGPGNLDPRNAFMDDADLFGRALRQIEAATGDKRATIVNSNIYRFAVFRVRDFDHRTNR